MNAFGLVIPGRPVVTTPDCVVSPTREVYNVPDAERVKNIAVFLTGAAALPESMGAAVFFAWPPYQSWRFLGHLSAAKPSAVFRANSDIGARAIAAVAQHVTAQLALELAPLDQIEAAATALQQRDGRSLSTQSLDYEDAERLPQRMAQHFFNYCTGFAAAQPVPQPGVQWAPVRVFDSWMESVVARTKQNPLLFLPQ